MNDHEGANAKREQLPWSIQKVIQWLRLFGIFLSACFLLAAASLIVSSLSFTMGRLWVSEIGSRLIAGWLERYGELAENVCDLIAFLFITPEIVKKLELPFTAQNLFLAYLLLSVVVSLFFVDVSDRFKSIYGIGALVIILLIVTKKGKPLVVPHSVSVSLALVAFLSARTLGVLSGLFKAGLVGE